MEQKIIDVSKHNGVIDFKKVKAAGIETVIIRAGYGRHVSQKDKKFEANYAGAKAAGLNVGAYWYSYAENKIEALQEAAACLECIKGKKFEFPVYFDIEDERQIPLGKDCCTEMTQAFCDALEKAKYFAGVYSFDSFFKTNLEPTIPTRYSAWVARIGKQPQCVKSYAMWQYSWDGEIAGINCDVDLNEAYKDFPKIIKNAHLNGY
jgi:GH25 family lysozyme M1 (1,4-beta-N-acetylmuramidase)